MTSNLNNLFNLMLDRLRKKLDVAFRDYIILGACNPSFAYKLLVEDDKIGTLLPCNVIIRESDHGYTEVAAIDPVEAMKMINKPEVDRITGEVRQRLLNALNRIRQAGE